MNGNGGRIVVLLVALLAIGILVLPSTVSLFAGQHYWYDLTGEVGSNEIPCQKCHADVFEELDQSNFHIGWGEDPDGADQGDCEACHRSNNTITYATVHEVSTNYTAGDEAHAASVVACMLCHQYDPYGTPGVPSDSDYAGFYAGGFNISGYGVDSPYGYSNDTHPGTYEAHNAFVARAIEYDTLQDSNEACVACHTHVAVKINWTHARSLEFDVGLQKPITTESGTHNWTVDNWDYNGTANATSWGNTTGYGTSSSWSEWPGEVPGVDYEYGS
ncbi:MAG: hypothetical protein ACOC5L_02590 [Halobacteriota archaeon]